MLLLFPDRLFCSLNLSKSEQLVTPEYLKKDQEIGHVPIFSNLNMPILMTGNFFLNIEKSSVLREWNQVIQGFRWRISFPVNNRIAISDSSTETETLFWKAILTCNENGHTSASNK